MMEKEALTVAELIALLQRCPQDALVNVEGCDCYGDASGVTIERYGRVTVRRDTSLGLFEDDREVRS